MGNCLAAEKPATHRVSTGGQDFDSLHRDQHDNEGPPVRGTKDKYAARYNGSSSDNKQFSKASRTENDRPKITPQQPKESFNSDQSLPASPDGPWSPRPPQEHRAGYAAHDTAPSDVPTTHATSTYLPDNKDNVTEQRKERSVIGLNRQFEPNSFKESLRQPAAASAPRNGRTSEDSDLSLPDEFQHYGKNNEEDFEEEGEEIQGHQDEEEELGEEEEVNVNPSRAVAVASGGKAFAFAEAAEAAIERKKDSFASHNTSSAFAKRSSEHKNESFAADVPPSNPARQEVAAVVAANIISHAPAPRQPVDTPLTTPMSSLVEREREQIKQALFSESVEPTVPKPAEMLEAEGIESATLDGKKEPQLKLEIPVSKEHSSSSFTPSTLTASSSFSKPPLPTSTPQTTPKPATAPPTSDARSVPRYLQQTASSRVRRPSDENCSTPIPKLAPSPAPLRTPASKPPTPSSKPATPNPAASKSAQLALTKSATTPRAAAAAATLTAAVPASKPAAPTLATTPKKETSNSLSKSASVRTPAPDASSLKAATTATSNVVAAVVLPQPHSAKEPAPESKSPKALPPTPDVPASASPAPEPPAPDLPATAVVPAPAPAPPAAAPATVPPPAPSPALVPPSAPPAHALAPTWKLIRIKEDTCVIKCDACKGTVAIEGATEPFKCQATLQVGALTATIAAPDALSNGQVRPWHFCPDPLCMGSKPDGSDLPKWPQKLPVDKGLKIARSDYNKLLAVKLDILLKG